MRQRPRPPALLPRRPRPLRLLPPRRPPRSRRNRRASRRHAKAARPRAANGPPCRPGTRSCSVARASETSHRTFSASGRTGSAVSWRSSGPERRGMQRVSQDPSRLTRVAVGRGAPAPDGQRFESHHIDRFRRHGQPVAGRVRLDHVTDSAWRNSVRSRETSVCSALPGLPRGSSGQIRHLPSLIARISAGTPRSIQHAA